MIIYIIYTYVGMFISNYYYYKILYQSVWCETIKKNTLNLKILL